MSYLTALLNMTFNILDLYARRNRPIRRHCQALSSAKHPAGMPAPLAVCRRVKVLSCYVEGLGFLLFEEGLAGSHRYVVASSGLPHGVAWKPFPTILRRDAR
jgi:hypothetical protein